MAYTLSERFFFIFFICFFFSSRRRHTRLVSDWSSDVCSSDLQRREDVPLLTEHFLRRFARSLGRAVRSVTAEAQQCLNSYDWPGNVRQLQSVLKYALIQSTGDRSEERRVGKKWRGRGSQDEQR